MATRFQLIIERAHGRKHILGRYVSPSVAARALKFWSAKMKSAKKRHESRGRLYVLDSDGHEREWWELKGYRGPARRAPDPTPHHEGHEIIRSRPPDWREADRSGLHNELSILSRMLEQQRERSTQ